MSILDTTSSSDESAAAPDVATGAAEQAADSAAPPAQRRMPDGWATRQLWLLGVRRRFLINRKRQLRVAGLILALVVALLIMVNFLFHALRTQETDVIVASAPALREVMEDYDRNEMLLGILASVVILAGVFVVTIIETHRTAGAAFNIGRRLGYVAEGRYDTRLVLRKGDNLRELEGPFNAMTQALRDQATEEASALERLADSLDPGQSQAADELRRMAASKRQRVEPE